MFTTTATITENLGILGLSIPQKFSGQQIGVTPYPPGAPHPAEFYQETPNGAIIPAKYLNFDLPTQI